MKVAIVGSRSITDYDLLVSKVESILAGKPVDSLVSGGARGVDSLAERFAREKSIPIDVIRPDLEAATVKRLDLAKELAE